jgi:hypothetical protein
VAGGNEVELVANTTDSATFYLAMKEKAARDDTIADEDELAEKRATLFLNEIFNLLASRNTNNAIAA